MSKAEFNCKVLTPLFLGGAKARVEPELRGPSIRGAMRYWYRAIVGGSSLASSSNDEKQLNALKEEEARVFGKTEQGSAVAVIVRAAEDPKIETFRKDRAIRTAEGDYLPTGKDYLLWSMAASGRPGTDRFLADREYIIPGTKFEIILRTWREDGSLEKATSALWLLTQFGALGSRANRGAGSIETQLKAPSTKVPLFKVCGSTDELQKYLSDGVRQCLSIIADGKAAWANYADRVAAYDILSPDTAEIWIVSNSASGWNSFLDALNGIGEKMRNYRSHRGAVGRADHDAVLNWLEGGKTDPQIRRTGFGLPIPFRYSEGGPSDIIISETSDQRASPLHIKITRLTTGKYVGVLTLFKSQFLEQGKKLQLQTRKWKAPPPADYTVIQNFIQTFETKRRVSL